MRVEKRRLDCTADGEFVVRKLDGRQLFDDSLGVIVDLVAVLADDLEWQGEKISKWRLLKSDN